MSGNYKGITLTDDDISIARARLSMRVQQSVKDMNSSSYDPGTIAHLVADLEALDRFEESSGFAEEPRSGKASRRGH